MQDDEAHEPPMSREHALGAGLVKPDPFIDVPSPTHLIMVSNTQTQELKAVSACASEKEADGVFDNLTSLFAGTHNIVHKVPLPMVPGFVSLAIVSAGEPPPSVTTLPSAVPPALAQPEPVSFRRVSQADFEAETIAMMNGEIPMDGIVARDADAPTSEGGAFS